MRANFLAALDPRTKLIAFLAVQALLFVPSPQPPRVRLVALAILLLSLLSLAGNSWRLWLRLLVISAPLLAFLAFSVFLQPGTGQLAPHWIGLLLAAKTALSLLSLALFILNEKPGRLLQALRQIGLPQAAVVILAIGYRFAAQWGLELEGLRRAWTGRNFAALSRWHRSRQLGRTLPLFFERLLESGVHVHDAMISRGFHGTLPAWQRLVFFRRDAVFSILVAMAVVAVALLG